MDVPDSRSPQPECAGSGPGPRARRLSLVLATQPACVIHRLYFLGLLPVDEEEGDDPDAMLA